MKSRSYACSCFWASDCNIRNAEDAPSSWPAIEKPPTGIPGRAPGCGTSTCYDKLLLSVVSSRVSKHGKLPNFFNYGIVPCFVLLPCCRIHDFINQVWHLRQRKRISQKACLMADISLTTRLLPFLSLVHTIVSSTS